MKECIGLAALRPGQRATVTALMAEGSIRRRLRDMGLIEGTRVECVGVSPLGDPAAYLVRGTVIALRRRDAEGILTRPEGEDCPEGVLCAAPAQPGRARPGRAL